MVRRRPAAGIHRRRQWRAEGVSGAATGRRVARRRQTVARRRQTVAHLLGCVVLAGIMKCRSELRWIISDGGGELEEGSDGKDRARGHAVSQAKG